MLSTLEVWVKLREPAPTLWGLGLLCRFNVRSELTPGCPVGIGELVAVGRDTHVRVRDKTQTDSFLSLVSGLRFRDRGLYYVEQNSHNSLPVFCIVRIPGRIR